VPLGPAASSRFVEVLVEPCAASEDGVGLRFKTAGAPRPVSSLPYESESGLAGTWHVSAVDENEEAIQGAAYAVLVEDSSDGTAWLVVGGRGGLLLEHTETGAHVREAYLVLSRQTDLA
jgi:hypothetical protein